MRWSYRHKDRNHYFSVLATRQPKATNNYYIWSRCDERNLCVLAAKSGQLIRKIRLPGSFTSIPVAYKEKVIIALDDNHGLVILGASN